MKIQMIFSLIGLALLVMVSAACSSPAPAAPPAATIVQTQPTVAPTTAPASGSVPAASMANPASVFCGQQGGKTDIRKDAKGGEVGYCVFADKSECEEWAFQRGECKPGAGSLAAASGSMANPASVFCGQQGGKTDIRKDAKGGEVGYCVFPDKSECEEWAFQRGECKPGAKSSSMQLSKADNGKIVQVAQGGTVEVMLEGNPGSTGYLWALESGNDAVLKPQGEYQFTSTSNLPGAGGKFSFKFTAASAGSATLKFANKQPWNLNDPKAETFAVTVQVTAAQSSAADPFVYCATVGNLDAPDARWTGAKVPDAVLTGITKALNLAPDMPKDLLAQSTFWRCMNNKVYACTVGANIPCQEKADTNKTPSAAMNDFCKASPASDFIPAYVTGRATVYDWKCTNGTATVNKQLTQPDARGFLAVFWYEISK